MKQIITSDMLQKGCVAGSTLGSVSPLHMGDLCPACGKGHLDYNGLLELECPQCGYRDTGGAIGT